MGSSRRVHLRLRERGGDGLGAASPDLVAIEIEAGQRPIEQNIESNVMNHVTDIGVLLDELFYHFLRLSLWFKL